MKIARTLVFAALGMLAFAPPSVAILYVCPTDSPGPCAAQELSPLPGEMVELYVQGSNGALVNITVSNGTIDNFVPEPSEVVQSHPSVFGPMVTNLRITGVRAMPVDPPTTTFRLGTLFVDASSGNINVSVALGSEGVAAGDVIEVINPAVIATPEPTGWLMLTAGSAVLAALSRLRSRQAKRRM
jgi:hypothetical protein